ncbi:hypothetical protein STSP2_01997 [Anaerohalosphaera lusitana]|uniref:LamG-like jellyroll fold domain-containing protein n=1 Tax=Anaerohalosphaera lusitana TaxID=1936003 RepID=A0A1U9NLL0_9BACT|nr:LamG-like jellyroll fold domain-containing protein [Anaerohalosphaera lusitana]AQT68821.1 hypothetical protein STSP2_01997 [Anaerohalosphaera lusitana]
MFKCKVLILALCAWFGLSAITTYTAGTAFGVLPDELTVNVGDVNGDGQNDNAILTKRSLRAPGYRVWAYDGSNYTQVSQPEVRTYRGYVDADPDLQVNGWVDENNCLDINFNEGRHHTLRLTNIDIDLAGPDGTPFPPTGNIEIPHTADRTSPTPTGYIIPKYNMRKMRVGVDICNDVYVAMGSISAAVGFCEQRINDSDHFYARDMGLAWEISEVVVRVGGDPDRWKSFWAGNDGITPYNFNTKVRFKAPGGGGSAGRIFSATADFPNGHSATVGSLSPYSRSLGHEVAHGLGVGHYSDVNDTMSGSNSALGVGTVQKPIEELHLASGTSAPSIIYGGPLAPYAMWDAANTMQDESVEINLLENDYDGNGDTISLSYVDSVSDRNGTITILSDRTVRYTPPEGYLGVDRFRYHVSDSTGLTNRTGLVKVYVRNTGLATHLTLDETTGSIAHDLGPYQTHGSLDSGTTPFETGSTTGIIGNALENLTDSSKTARIRCDTGDPLTDSLSASLWVKFNTLPDNDYPILTKGAAVIRGRVDNIRGGWAISVDNGKFYFACKLQTDSQYKGHLADLRTSANVQTGQWYHLVMTMDRDNHKLRAWVNNTEVTNTLAGTTIPDGMIENYYPLTLFNCSNDNASLPCVMDEVRIYNKVLSAAEVAELYAADYEIPAGAPEPANHGTCAFSDTTLTWVPGKPSGYEFDIYFGTDHDAVAAATTSSSQYMGRKQENSHAVTVRRGKTYFWRVDEVADDTVVPGNVWTFKTLQKGFDDYSVNVTNGDFENQIVEPDASVKEVMDWYDSGSYVNTVWSGYDTDEYPQGTEGSNWLEMGNSKWAYQRTGDIKSASDYRIGLMAGKKTSANFKGLVVSLWAGGEPEAAADGIFLSDIGAVQLDTSGLLMPPLSGNQSEQLYVTLSARQDLDIVQPLWLCVQQGGGYGRSFADNVEIAKLITGEGLWQFAELKKYYNTGDCGICGGADLNADNIVNLTDLAMFASTWLEE